VAVLPRRTAGLAKACGSAQWTANIRKKRGGGRLESWEVLVSFGGDGRLMVLTAGVLAAAIGAVSHGRPIAVHGRPASGDVSETAASTY